MPILCIHCASKSPSAATTLLILRRLYSISMFLFLFPILSQHPYPPRKLHLRNSQAVQKFRRRRGAHHPARNSSGARINRSGAALRALPAQDARRRPTAHMPRTRCLHDGLCRRYVSRPTAPFPARFPLEIRAEHPFRPRIIPELRHPAAHGWPPHSAG